MPLPVTKFQPHHGRFSWAVLLVMSAHFLSGGSPVWGNGDTLCFTGDNAVSNGVPAMVTVMATVSFRAEAVEFGVCHNEAQVAVQSADARGTDVAALHDGAGPQYLETLIDDGIVRFSMLVDYPRPSQEALLPGTHTILNIIYRQSATSQEGSTTLTFCPDLVTAAYSDENGSASFPVTCEWTLAVGGGIAPPPALFVRGDVDGDGKPIIGDIVLILMHIFGGDTRYTCEKAMDTNDDGSLDVSDAVYLANYMFSLGPPMPAPFPDRGLDLTDDDLPCDTVGSGGKEDL